MTAVKHVLGKNVKIKKLKVVLTRTNIMVTQIEIGIRCTKCQ